MNAYKQAFLVMNALICGTWLGASFVGACVWYESLPFIGVIVLLTWYAIKEGR